MAMAKLRGSKVLDQHPRPASGLDVGEEVRAAGGFNTSSR